ncbi:hypothetical protein BJ944DRAFT_244709 [Cunninghamella echinulata]|nr:hypothetical protein BJ944DRAFT_244709 [Cunninghamella echinulata]
MLHSYPPPIASDAYIPSAMKAESDPRLPGVMVLSQPSTPRPTSIINEESNAMDQKNRNSYVSSYSSISPYPLMPRKRSRNDNSLFPTETGPSFSAAKPLDNLFSPDRTNLLTVRVQSKMDRGFFLADNDWTCYRRNYFQVSSTFSIHGINRYYGEHELQCFVQTAHHGLQPVNRFLLGISARVSNSDKQIELVQHTPKRDKGPQTKPLPKPITPNGNLSLSSVGTNQNIATFERIQFKTATANNGKRRAAQQYYIVAVELFAETHEGERVCVASCISSPLVVRGRSPGHYADNNQDRTSSNTNPSLMAAVANASAAMPTANNHPNNSNPNSNNNNNNDDDERYPYSRQPPMPGHPLMSNPSQEYSSPYTSYYNGYPPPPPYGMMIPPPPPPSSSSSNNNNNNNNNNTANNNNSNNNNHNNSNHNNNHTSSPPSHHLPHPHSHQANAPPPPNPPYMVHSMSADPSSSESSSPDMYQGASEYTIQHSDKHISQLNIHPISMDSNGAHTNEWSRSRYHSAGSVPSPHNDHPHSYFSQQHHHHHHQQQDGAPPTPTTPFSKKYDTIPSTTEQHTN